jgi:SAM-dependent methyltransferase
VDPYFAVLTDEKYRRPSLDDARKEEFFQTGERHTAYLLQQCAKVAGNSFKPRRALDFGCGVGRVTIPLARGVEAMVGADVSPGMLAEAQRNAAVRGQSNIAWVQSDDGLTSLEGGFDLIHSCITFQHIAPLRGRVLFARLLGRLAPGGVGALQITYAKKRFASRWGQVPYTRTADGAAASAPEEPGKDPEMQMNAYHLGELAFVMQACGIREFHSQFTDHGGEWGVFMFFLKPQGPK